MRVAILLVALLPAACGGSPKPPTTPEGRFNPGLLSVGTVTVNTAEAPAAVSVFVQAGGVPCTRVGEITQTRTGNVVEVTIQSYWTSEFCVMSLVNIDHTFRLTGPFAPGEYLVRVNGVEARFRV